MKNRTFERISAPCVSTVMVLILVVSMFSLFAPETTASSPSIILRLEAYEQDLSSSPFVMPWNGSHYVIDNDLYPEEGEHKGSDAIDYYMLEQPLVPKDGEYSLLLQEIFDGEIDHHDTVRLITVDHSLEVNVGIDEHGTISTYRTSLAPISAIDNFGNDVLAEISSLDSQGANLYHNDSIIVDFGMLDTSQGAKLLLSYDGYGAPRRFEPFVKYFMEVTLHVQTRNSTGHWETRYKAIPRDVEYLGVYDLAPYLPDPFGEVKVRLLTTMFKSTAGHFVNYVAFDNTANEPVTTNTLAPTSAIHSSLGDVLSAIVDSDDIRVDVRDGENITVTFPYIPTSEVRDFIIFAEGWYDRDPAFSGSYTVEIWNPSSSSWQNVPLPSGWGNFGPYANDKTKDLDITSFVPIGATEVKVRINQYLPQRMLAAIDYVALIMDGVEIHPTEATDQGPEREPNNPNLLPWPPSRPKSVLSEVMYSDDVRCDWWVTVQSWPYAHRGVDSTRRLDLTFPLNLPPHADFVYSPSRPQVCETVTFNASTSTPNGGNITQYTWNFDDGNITTVSSPIITHHYATYGTFNVTLTVIDTWGESDTTWKLVNVREHPHADFTWSPFSPQVSENVTFNATVSTPDGGVIVSYAWDFDDGTPIITENDPIITHHFSTWGNFTVTLNVTDSEDKWDTESHTIRVREHPHAAFTYSPPWPQVCEMVTFNASASTPDGGSIVSYEWDFDDGNITTISDPIIIHHYATYGVYNVTLTVHDSENKTDNTWQLVNVREHPKAAFTPDPSDPGTNETITFNASASTPDGGTITNYRWNFDDGNITDTPNPIITHHYTTSGVYNVTLTVFDSEDKNDTTWRLVTVTTHDVAVVDVTPESEWLYQGKLCRANINVTVTNEGEVPETFDVTVYADSNTTNIGDEYSVGTQTITLSNGSSTTLTFTWDTNGVTPCRNYTITAVASVVPHETDTADNTMFSPILVKVRLLADVNDDGKVDIKDIARAALAFGSFKEPYLHPRWNPEADINNDGKIDIRDMALIAKNFGKTCL